MTAQSVAVGFTVAAVCGVLAFIALLRQAARHSDERAVLLRGQLDARRAGQASVQGQAADDGDPLECWEWDEMDRIERLYADNADEPAQRPGGTS